MANNVIGLFESQAVADQVAEDLRASGFNQHNITRFEENKSDLEGELRREGIPDDEVSYYVNGLSEGGALISVRAEESDTDIAVEIMNRYADTGAGDSSYDASFDSARTEVELGTTTADYSTARSTNLDDEARLDVVEERLNIGKRDVERGGVRVRRVVTETPVEEQVSFRDETIEVEHHAVDRRVAGDVSDIFLHGDPVVDPTQRGKPKGNER